MKQYHDLLRHILENGSEKTDRTGVGNISTFGYQSRYRLSDGFPLVTTKRAHVKSVIHELLWFIAGQTNIRALQINGVSIWNEWADQDGRLGPVYGHQWRNFMGTHVRRNRGGVTRYAKINVSHSDDGTAEERMAVINGIDQLREVIRQIKGNPDSRRLIVTAWNPLEIEEQGLPPCHCFFQFYVNNGELSCHMYQRSADAFLGVPFNVASYALLTMLVAQVTGYKPGDFVHTFGDLHIYKNHMEQVKLQLSRECRPLPRMIINPDIDDIDSFQYVDFTLEGYDPHPSIVAAVAV